jgi:hypothetical protein
MKVLSSICRGVKLGSLAPREACKHFWSLGQDLILRERKQEEDGGN